MGGNDPGVEYAQGVEVFHRCEPTVGLFAVLHFLQGLAEVDVEGQIPFFGEVRGP